ncbi:hypothetical protein, partial [Microcoleus sp. B3-D7]|uniref:hypothetical protein n=1 Tax=Microcoleus sp. B3-D7 TaxID=2818659 RepID=UPI00403F1806
AVCHESGKHGSEWEGEDGNIFSRPYQFLVGVFSSCLLAQPVRHAKRSKMVASTTVNNGLNAINVGDSSPLHPQKKVIDSACA